MNRRPWRRDRLAIIRKSQGRFKCYKPWWKRVGPVHIPNKSIEIADDLHSTISHGIESFKLRIRERLRRHHYSLEVLTRFLMKLGEVGAFVSGAGVGGGRWKVEKNLEAEAGFKMGPSMSLPFRFIVYYLFTILTSLLFTFHYLFFTYSSVELI